jgi:hypothetical protein
MDFMLQSNKPLAIIVAIALTATGCAKHESPRKETKVEQTQTTGMKPILGLQSTDSSQEKIHGFLRCNYQTIDTPETLSVTVKSKGSCPAQILYDFSTNDWTIRKTTTEE